MVSVTPSGANKTYTLSELRTSETLCRSIPVSNSAFESVPSATGSVSIGAAYLAGNSAILVRLPSGLPTFTPLYRRLVEDDLKNVTFIDDNGRAFLDYSYRSDKVGGVVIFGDESWIDNYRRQALQTMKKTIFEGPGNDPFIVFSDADVKDAARAAVATGFANAGQDCASAERFFVHESVAGLFKEALIEKVRKLSIGSVHDEQTDIGPIASASALKRLKQQMKEALASGAVALCGGSFVQLRGHQNETCEPTVLENCHPNMKIMREETFGPVIPIVTFHDEEEALALAEGTDYGLSATVYGGPRHFGKRLIRSHGNVFTNECIEDGENSFARLRWGGFGRSGWVWEKQESFFVQREGPRSFVRELSQPSRNQ